MDIRHRQQLNRKVLDVMMDRPGQYYYKIVQDVVFQYPFKYWESAEEEQWEAVEALVSEDLLSLRVGTSHVASILNKNDFRFVKNNRGGLTGVERRVS